MSGEEVAIVGIVFGSIITIVFLGVVGSIIKGWVSKGSTKDLSKNKEFLAALREFKEKTDKRLSNLEAIVADENPRAKKQESSRNSDSTKRKSAIELEVENESTEEKPKESSKLKNMLNQ